MKTPHFDCEVGLKVYRLVGARGIAAVISDAGASVRLARESEAKARGLLGGIGAAMALPLDVTDERSIETAVRAVLGRCGRIDALDNAGYALHGAIEVVDVEAVTRMFNVNADGG